MHAVNTISYDNFSDGIKCIYDSIEKATGEKITDPSNYILIFNSPSDICLNMVTALRIIYVLAHIGFTVYIVSFSLNKSFDEYADKVLEKYEVFYHEPRTAYPEDLLEYAADLKWGQDWSYGVITEKTGIARDTLIHHLHRGKNDGLINDGLTGKRESENKKFGKKEEDTILFLKCGMNLESAKKLAEFYDEIRKTREDHSLD